MRRFSGIVICLFAGLLPAIAVAASASSVGSRLPCNDYQMISQTLDERYGEILVSLGVQANGHVLQVFTSPESGSWTILSVAPTGVGCIVAAGKNWHDQTPLPDDPAT